MAGVEEVKKSVTGCKIYRFRDDSLEKKNFQA